MKASLHATLILTGMFLCGHARGQDIDRAPLPPPDGPGFRQLQEQLEGDYPPLSDQASSVGGAIQEIWNDAPPEAGVLHVRNPVGKTIKVRIRESMPLTITLPPGQKVLDTTLGDTQAFGTRACPSDDGCIWVWANHPGFDSLITIVTRDRIVYPIYIRGEAFNSRNIPHTWLRLGSGDPGFESPRYDQDLQGDPVEDDPLSEVMDPSAAPVWTRPASFDPAKIRHDIAMTGDAEIAPVTVWRDDKFTWLDWGENTDPRRWPAAWEVVDGIDQPVRVRKTRDNRFLIVETTGPITLRRGEKTVCLRPEKS